MHLLVDDPAGPIVAGRKPTGAAAFEDALRRCPGSPGGTLGKPGKRSRIACGSVRRPTEQHRVTVTPEMVNCPKCRKLLEGKRGSQAG
jgi:hypothetical protein